MIVGVARETKSDEYRVALLPVGAELLKKDGHTVLIEKNAGIGSGYPDEEYAKAGATIIETPDEIYAKSDMIVSVKEPQPQEIEHLRKDQIVFCYFHFAASRPLTEGCLKRGIAAVAFETLEAPQGGLPLLKPMSEVAGKMSIQEGAKYLEKPMMGRGILLGGVAGVEPATVLILGGGIVGTNAARVAAGLGAHVILMDVNIERLRYLEEVMPANVHTVYCDPHAVRRYVTQADLVVGAVLIYGGRAPHLVTKDMLPKMKAGAVIVDVSVDQGGCIETIHPTTHKQPTYIVDEVVHYGVANMPGAVGRTSTQALDNATIPYVRELAGKGLDAFLKKDHGRANALNMRGGKLTHPAVIVSFPDLPHT